MSAINFSSDFAALAGGLRVVPGAQPPQALQSSRRNWAAQLAVGQSAMALPTLLASVFNLCSHAHRVCAQLCAALGPGADLRVHARIATITGWAELERGEHDRCGPMPPRPVRLDAHPRGLHE